MLQEFPLSVCLPILLLLCAATLAALGGLLLLRQFGRKSGNGQREIAALRSEVSALRQSALAQLQAGAASEAKSRFLANVSHEVRTPLAGIAGMADLLTGTRLSGEQRAYVEAIRQSGSALAGLVDEILDFSKMGSGKLELRVEPVDIASLVEGVIELMAPRAQANTLEIACLVTPAVPAIVIADAARLRQILLNLVGNAIKFTPNGGVGVKADAHNDVLQFTVTDTGTGIPADRQHIIFEEFEQADGSTSRQYGGTGLGLTIARELAGAMNGTLVLQASSPEGSSFRLDLPLVAAEAKAFQKTSPQYASTRRALIVAATRFEAGFLAERLEALGFSTRTEAKGKSAVEWLETAPAPDLVIVDCALGPRLVKELSAACAAAKVGQSLILFSPLERRGLGEILSGGYDGWLVKPVRRDSLLTLLGQRGEPGSTAPPVPFSVAMPARLRVLVAEDNDINALIATRLLARLGADVVRAADGPGALALARRALLGESAAFDLILMDLRMPGLDGRDVTRAIRSIEENLGRPQVRIFALTANNQDRDKQSCLAAGFDGFLAKPVDFAALSRLLAPTPSLRRMA